MDGPTRIRESEAAVLEDEIAEQCGILNVATGRLVALIGRVLVTESYAGAGIRSAEQWVAWKCGVSTTRARSLVSLARRLPELPVTRSALEAGKLAEDQVAVICRHTPTHYDAEAAELGRAATVTQLRRALGRHSFAEPVARPDSTAEAESEPEERRRVNFGFDDDGWWRLNAVLPTRRVGAPGRSRRRSAQPNPTASSWSSSFTPNTGSSRSMNGG
ncbi:MAG: 13E12 repeat family protein [Actinomycetota bacterium]|nr:13E12 repeat family protein [Actinomycetota bacterium]